MPSLDNLPGDQRAVLQLVLGRGRSYIEIARLLTIDAVKVRERALTALDALGPQTDLARGHKDRIGDYLLGQLPEQDVAEVQDLLADSPSDRAWARVVSSELASLAAGPMPDIPSERSAPRSEEPPAVPLLAPQEPGAAAPPPAPQEPADAAPPTTPQEPAAPQEPPRARLRVPPRVEPGAGAGPRPQPERLSRRERRRRDKRQKESQPTGARSSSRLGGALLILAGVVAVAAILFFVLRSGGSKTHTVASTSSPTTSAPAASTPTTPTATTSGSGSSTAAKVVSQINLTPPSGTHNSKAAGIAEVLNEGGTNGIAVVAQHIAPNTTKPPNAYAVWLYNSPGDAHILGFVNPGVTKTGRLSTAGGLPSNASHFKQLIVTLETTASPKTPGTIVLEGTLTGL
jgi:hypothetical protein